MSLTLHAVVVKKPNTLSQATKYAKHFIDKTYPYFQNMTGEQALAYANLMNPSFNNPWVDHDKTVVKTKSGNTETTTTDTGKYGKMIKPKIKPKLKRKK